MKVKGWLGWFMLCSLLLGWIGYSQFNIQQQLSYLKTENEMMDAAEKAVEVTEEEPLKSSGREVDRVLHALESKEARVMVDRLVRQNETLTKEKLVLRKQINRLSASLAMEKVENDDLRLRITQGNIGKSLPVTETVSRTYQAKIVDVNTALNMVVLNIGSIQGMKSGMFFGIVRKNLVIGKVKIFDVRDRVSGALVIEKNKEGFESGDRAVPWTERYGS